MGKTWLRDYIIKRLIYSVIIAWGILTITFVLVRVGPSSPADKYLANLTASGQDVAEVVAAIEARYGLDKPLWEQYFEYIGNLLRGNWGWSFSTSMPVMELIKTHWIYSFQLILLSSIFAAILGILIGIYSAVKQYTKTDYALTFMSFVGISLPNFWLGVMLILVFSVKMGIFKTYYDTTLPLFSLENLKALVLPVMTLGTGMVAGYVRYTRSAMLDNLRKGFVTTARAKGLPEHTVIGKHVFRNAMLPLITIIMFDLGSIVFGGAYLTEIVFGIPGLGQVSFNAIFANDYPIVVAVTLIGTLLVLMINLVTDITYTYLDPRIRYD
ncbi:MAG: ABC transporter permease [Chloroflexi bacterium]|nr:ABC transporter permease [Chloroflexota bacterium]MBM3154767.1 ABC transporter permease [Chloroflexota bacterium]MBM3175020.1 ABC transporter permease [Chloroflexota bacterium]MBM4450034.1 ABC transporter permease [Chloroflexota bacterium]